MTIPFDHPERQQPSSKGHTGPVRLSHFTLITCFLRRFIGPVALSLVLLLAATTLVGCGTDEPAPAEDVQAQGEQDAHDEEEDGHAEEGEVHLTNQQVQELGIQVQSLEAGSASSTLSRPATVAFDLDRVAKVGPRISAKVVRVLKDLGDRVEQGEALAAMSSVELGKAKTDYLIARARLETAEATYKREQSLYDQKISSEAELLEARARFRETRAEAQADREALRLYSLSNEEIDAIQAGGEQPLSYFQLRSPAAGVVQERDVSPGQTVEPNETPFHVADLRRLWILIEAFERDVPLLATGQKVELVLRSLPDRSFEGRTDWVSYALDSETRTLHVRAVVDNTGGVLRAGMFGTARIYTDSAIRHAMIPVDAVQTIEGEQVVFVPGEEAGSFTPVTVLLGEESDGYVEIVSGLEPGARAVVVGAFDLMSALTASSRSADHGH